MTGVRVKHLAWEAPRDTEGGGLAQDAECSIGHYIASDVGWFLMGRTGWNFCNGRETAKAAAQADYETRILAALEPQDAPAVAEELVALQAEVAQWRNAGLHLADEYPVSAFGLPGNDDVRGYGWIKVIAEMAGVKSRKEVRAALTHEAKS